MSAHRFFLTEPLPSDPGEPLPLCDADLHHAVSVLRVRPGERLDVVEPGARAWKTEVVSAGTSGIIVRIFSPIAEHTEPDLTLFQGVAKGDKMDDIVRQAVEVGATRIVPILTARSVVRLDAEKRTARTERWRRIAESAAKQAKRDEIPTVEALVDLREALPLLAGFEAAVVAWEDAEDEGLFEAVSRIAAAGAVGVALVVGPEGGFAAEEIEQLRQAGAVTASLGRNILRTETAAVVALALASVALGGMGGSGV